MAFVQKPETITYLLIFLSVALIFLQISQINHERHITKSFRDRYSQTLT